MIGSARPAAPASMPGAAARPAGGAGFADTTSPGPQDPPSEGRLGAWADSSAVLVAGADVTEFDDIDGAALMREFFAASASPGHDS